MFKKVVKEFQNKKVLVYYQEREHVFNFISIHKNEGGKDYTYWLVEVPKQELNLDQLEESFIHLILYNSDYANEGYSFRGSLSDLAEELIEWIPTLVADVREIESQLLVL